METPPLRHFIVVISLLALFVLLVSTIPVEFYAYAKEYRAQEVPEYFESIDLQQYASYYVQNISSATYFDWWGKTEFGYDMHFYAYVDDLEEGGHQIRNYHGYTFLGFWTGGHKQDWLNQNGYTRGNRLSDEEIDLDFKNDTSEYTVKCNHFQMRAWVAYNTSKFDNSKDAWDNYGSEPFDGLMVLFAIEFDEMGTGLNAWNLVGMILFFQMPEVHPLLNMIIAVPIWACIAWLAFAFIIAVIKSLPFT